MGYVVIAGWQAAGLPSTVQCLVGLGRLAYEVIVFAANLR
jgi:hypothetical protein